ncbi:MAG: CDP-alcohol phosphatidyltransferase family protein [Elusimicrobiota bacterium]|jgi:CDP-diacylglycerol--glycerol-3-phosphate 3-phosphatidyltransferase|nr:CDP-alcohol phosphatidyltransferase family protein [Elusimicrobiota bacterium]
MISVYQLKTKFQNILRPLTNALAKAGITANHVTISAFMMSALVGFIIYKFAHKNNIVLLILPIFLFVRMALNAIDGMLAREHAQKSRLGAILNELGDVLSDAVIYAPFLIVIGTGEYLTITAISLAIISETVGIMGIQIGADRRYDGPMGKSDRAFWFSVIAILEVLFKLPLSVINALIGIIAALLVFTIFNRIKKALEFQPAAKEDK